jgi:hypothetical protein
VRVAKPIEIFSSGDPGGPPCTNPGFALFPVVSGGFSLPQLIKHTLISRKYFHMIRGIIHEEDSIMGEEYPS